jgi:PncC family amidohydrolase
MDIAELLVKKRMTLSICESCTGGMLGSMLTRIPGSSRFFLGGIIAYANQVKQKIVGVHEKILKRHGAVSGVTALEMARGVRRKFRSDIALAITGIAGPSGGSKTKPVGTVFICIVQNGKSHTDHHVFMGNRAKIRKAACARALGLLKKALIGSL